MVAPPPLSLPKGSPSSASRPASSPAQGKVPVPVPAQPTPDPKASPLPQPVQAVADTVKKANDFVEAAKDPVKLIGLIPGLEGAARNLGTINAIVTSKDPVQLLGKIPGLEEAARKLGVADSFLKNPDQVLQKIPGVRDAVSLAGKVDGALDKVEKAGGFLQRLSQSDFLKSKLPGVAEAFGKLGDRLGSLPSVGDLLGKIPGVGGLLKDGVGGLLSRIPGVGDLLKGGVSGLIGKIPGVGGLLKDGVSGLLSKIPGVGGLLNGGVSGLISGAAGKLFGAGASKLLGSIAGGPIGLAAGFVLDKIPGLNKVFGAVGEVFGKIFGGLFGGLPSKGTQVREAVTSFLKKQDVDGGKKIDSRNYGFDFAKGLIKSKEADRLRKESPELVAGEVAGDKDAARFLVASKQLIPQRHQGLESSGLSAELKALGFIVTAQTAEKVKKNLDQTTVTFANMVAENLEAPGKVERFVSSLTGKLDLKSRSIDQLAALAQAALDQGKIAQDTFDEVVIGLSSLFER